MNSLYTMVYGRFNLKQNKRFDSFSWSSVVRGFYTKKGYMIEELNEEQDQAWQIRKKKRLTPFFASGFFSLIRLLRVY